MSNPRAVVGVIGKPLGLGGEVFVRPDPDVHYPFAKGDVVSTPDGRSLTVATSRSHSGRLVVRFEGVTDRETAETLRGSILEIPREDVTLDDEAWWSEDLVGREVVDDDGALVGIVESTLDGAAHDYLVVARPDGGEVMLPAVAELLDVSDQAIIVHAIPGLLDPDEGGG